MISSASIKYFSSCEDSFTNTHQEHTEVEEENRKERNSRNNFNSTIASSTSQLRVRCVYIYKFISCRAMIMKKRVGCSIANNYPVCARCYCFSSLLPPKCASFHIIIARRSFDVERRGKKWELHDNFVNRYINNGWFINDLFLSSFLLYIFMYTSPHAQVNCKIISFVCVSFLE